MHQFSTLHVTTCLHVLFHFFVVVSLYTHMLYTYKHMNTHRHTYIHTCTHTFYLPACYSLSCTHCLVFDCGMANLTAPVNGQLTVDSTLLDSMASYTCDSGYTLVGVAMRTCTVNGWNGTNPVCGKVILNIL